MSKEPNLSNLIEALTILLKYDDKIKPLYYEDDLLYVWIDPSIVMDRDLKKLALLGFVASENGCFKSSRYVSL